VITHLHDHSHYSLLDGLPNINELVKTAKKRGFSALALTDHGNMYGAIEFYEACLKEEIKPIIGMEGYIASGSRFEKNPQDKYFHILLLAENYTGYKNLMKLSSLAHLEGFYYKPRMDKELLRQYSEGLICGSACMGGEIPRILHRENNYEKAKAVALEYDDIFGRGNFFLELMDIPALEGQAEVNNQLIQISKETGIPLIVTRDVHYLNPEDAEAQDTLTCIRDGKTLEDTDRKTMVGMDFSLCEEKEIATRFKHEPEAIENTGKIAQRVNLT
jgi:DNA polymerase-3 subunit alpha